MDGQKKNEYWCHNYWQNCPREISSRYLLNKRSRTRAAEVRCREKCLNYHCN